MNLVYPDIKQKKVSPEVLIEVMREEIDERIRKAKEKVAKHEKRLVTGGYSAEETRRWRKKIDRYDN